MAARVRKQFLLDPEVLQKAREALGARTDTETVDRALRSVAIDAELTEALAEYVMTEGQILDVFGRLEE
jgi:Arc/MetJ family transcription regulator